MSLENARYRRRTWNRKKSYLPKHSSLPELQLLPKERPHFHCRRCGFTNTLIPLCLWCTWTSQEAEHEFELSTPRARRASAPAKVFFQVELVSTNEQNNGPHDHLSTSYTSVASKRLMSSSRKRQESPCFPENDLPAARFISIPEARVQQETTNRDLSDGIPAAARRDCIGDYGDVPTATQSRSSLAFAQAQTARQEEPNLNLRLDAHSSSDLRDPLLNTLPSEEEPRAARVDHSPPPMTTMKSFRNLKASRRLLIIDINDTKTPSGDDDTHEHLTILNTSINQDGSKPSSPIRPDILPRQQQLRTLRRKKHLNIMQASIPDANAAEPIAISLNLRSPTSQHVLKSPQQQHPTSPTRTLNHSHSRTFSQRSITSESGSDPTTPPLTPAQLPSPPRTAPARLSTTSPTSSPVRLGHPSRPYYSAIRKNGISPPPSRPTSIIGPSPTLTTRPQSYTPPSRSILASSTQNSTTASRHLSMSAMFVSPPYSAPGSGEFSAFSLMDDADNDDDENEDDLPILPPTPAPGLMTFSLSSASRRLSHGSQIPRGHRHSDSMSLSQARAKGSRGSGIGFSMSGETELRMALAAGAASAGVVEDGFRFRETTLSTPSNISHGIGGGSDIRPANALRPGSRNSFMGRVRKLRKGLKEMLLMTSTTTTTTTTTP